MKFYVFTLVLTSMLSCVQNFCIPPTKRSSLICSKEKWNNKFKSKCHKTIKLNLQTEFDQINTDLLNEAQLEAVTFPKQGIIRVLAGPGSGKTRVLTYRIGFLVNKGVAPRSILAVTFTNKAATEMKERVEALVGKGKTQQIAVGTFHSICARVLRQFGHLLPAPLNSRYTILDQNDMRDIVKNILVEELNIDPQKFKPAAMASCISRIKATGKDFRSVVEDEFPDNIGVATAHLKEVYDRYQKQIQSNNAMDFDDLLVRALDMIKHKEEVRTHLRRQWRQILVDEWQDTNIVQYDLVRILAQGMPGDPPLEGDEQFPRGLLVVGDADQSIYGWRGASWENVQRLEEDFKNVSSIVLKKNYRSTSNIANAAQKVIQAGANRISKDMVAVRGEGPPVQITCYLDDYREASGVRNTIREMIRSGTPHNEIAVLYRTNAQSRAMEQACVEARLPYTIVGGQRFYERREIKDILLYLRALNNPNDLTNLLKAANTPLRGCGITTLNKFADWVKEVEEENSESSRACVTTLLSLIPPQVFELRLKSFEEEAKKTTFWPGVNLVHAQNLSRPSNLSIPSINKLTIFAELMLYLWVKAQTLTLSELIEEILESLDYNKHLKWMSKDADNLEDRILNVEEMVRAAEIYSDQGAASKGALQDFLENVSLMSLKDDDNGQNETQSTLRLSTVHAAKGLEFETVFMIGMEEGSFPLSRNGGVKDLEEERRLAYVGITRAKSQLLLSYREIKNTYRSCKNGRVYIPNVPSQFLINIDPDQDKVVGTAIKEGYNLLDKTALAAVEEQEEKKKISAKEVVKKALKSGERLRISTEDLLKPKAGKEKYEKSGQRPFSAQKHPRQLQQLKKTVKSQEIRSNSNKNNAKKERNESIDPTSSADLLASLGYKIGVTIMHPVHGKGKINGVQGDMEKGAEDLKANVTFEHGQMPVPISSIQIERQQ